METMINVRDFKPGFEAAARYFHSKWGRPENFAFYHDAIAHSSPDPVSLPRFYLLLEGD